MSVAKWHPYAPGSGSYAPGHPHQRMQLLMYSWVSNETTS